MYALKLNALSYVKLTYIRESHLNSLKQWILKTSRSTTHEVDDIDKIAGSNQLPNQLLIKTFTAKTEWNTVWMNYKEHNIWNNFLGSIMKILPQLDDL